MARGGINKALVSKARDAVLSKGDNPSIDAVRVELGNTGSKSTIHRYLKEIEAEASSRLDDAALLSQPINELIGRLASTLHQEASTVVITAKEQFQSQLSKLKVDAQKVSGQLAESEKRLSLQEAELLSIKQDKTKLGEQLHAANLALQKAEQQNQGLNAIISEKNDRISSLEEKHIHSREALEHYRESVKTQKEQDATKHDQQLQQAQAETRQLNQLLSVKQSDITQLNKDNSRLVTEVSETRKSLLRAESSLQTSSNQLKTAETSLAALKTEADKQAAEEKALVSSNESLKATVEDLNKQINELTIHKAKQEAEILVKSEMIERVMAAKNTVEN